MKYVSAVFSSIFVLAGGVIVAATTAHGFEVVSPDGDFSYRLPKDWKLVNATGARYKVAEDPQREAKIIVNTSLAFYNLGEKNIAPLILERFRDETLRRAAKREPDFKVIENAKFRTSSNQEGLRTLTRVKRNGVLFKESLYFFEQGITIIWIICSGPGDGSLDGQLESIMKTFNTVET